MNISITQMIQRDKVPKCYCGMYAQESFGEERTDSRLKIQTTPLSTRLCITKHGSQTGVGDNGTFCDGNLQFMARKSVHPSSRVNGEIFEEPPLTDLQILNTSKEDPLTANKLWTKQMAFTEVREILCAERKDVGSKYRF